MTSHVSNLGKGGLDFRFGPRYGIEVGVDDGKMRTVRLAEREAANERSNAVSKAPEGKKYGRTPFQSVHLRIIAKLLGKKSRHTTCSPNVTSAARNRLK